MDHTHFPSAAASEPASASKAEISASEEAPAPRVNEKLERYLNLLDGEVNEVLEK